MTSRKNLKRLSNPNTLFVPTGIGVGRRWMKIASRLWKTLLLQFKELGKENAEGLQ